jgi:predicted cation transporter
VVITGLMVILILVLSLPFLFRKVEENLELFLFIMGIGAALISSKMNMELVHEALVEPIMIAGAVLLAGTLFFLLREPFSRFMGKVCLRFPLALVVFLVVLILGLASSIITAIVASIILVEIIFQLPLERKHKIVICILSCYSIGLGAALTPIGEPLATIAISKLNQDFMFLIRLLGQYIIPAVVIFSLMAGIYVFRLNRNNEAQDEMAASSEEEELSLLDDEEIEADTWQGVILRAVKVYLFVMALVFLGTGFEPLIEKYILGLSPQILYWVNMVSAVLDNATLAAAELSPAMMVNPLVVKAILMGLLISGGMLIPGNIPNIISVSKLRIGSKEWATYGVPIGLVFMAMFFVIMFIVEV